MQCTSIARMGMMRDVSEMVRSCSQGSQLLLRLDALLTWLYAVCKRDTEPSHGGWLGKIASDTGQSRDFGSVAVVCIDGSVMSGNHRPDASLGSCSMPANGAIVVQFIQMPLGRCPEARPLDLTPPVSSQEWTQTKPRRGTRPRAPTQPRSCTSAIILLTAFRFDPRKAWRSPSGLEVPR